MTDFDTDDYDDDDEQPDQPSKQERNWKELRGKASEYEQRAKAAERRLAFVEAGIKLDDPKAKYFVNGYDGEIDPDAIRQAAIEAGFLEDTTTTPPAEEEALGRMTEAATGAEPAGQIRLEDAINQAESPEEVMRIAAAAGMPTVQDSQ